MSIIVVLIMSACACMTVSTSAATLEVCQGQEDVWHALYKPTKAIGGNTARIPAMTGWVSFYCYYNVSHRYFASVKEMLSSGYLEKGDVI